jgi:transposase
MKKVCTVGAKPSRNFPQQRLTIGLDLGDRSSWYCVMDEAGQIQLEQRVRTSAKALQEAFGTMPRSRIALEIGTHSPWISRLLSGLGHEVIVANARKVRLIGKEGDPYLRTLLVQGAQHILGPFGVDCDLRRWGLKLAARGGRSGKKRAIVATARKLAALLHHLWVSGEVYQPLHNSSRANVAAAA